MIVCICEKPDVARIIASILGADSRRDGYWEGKGYQVTWTYGHLCTLLEPHDYEQSWKRWSLSALPMIPQKFDIKLIDNDGYHRQFKIIEELFKNADAIVNCGDAGQEGELIQRWVMKKAGSTCPVKRLWISSLTDDAIREGFSKLESQENYDRLYYAGLSRAIGDWILGMNATRLYTLKYSRPGTVLSIGRVQTPTLAMIVRRQEEIDNFVPKDSWELSTRYRETVFTSTGDRFETEAAGMAALESIKGHPFTITDISRKKGRESAPRLFDLTSLQAECNKRFGWGASRTLELIQGLYEKKLTTYPRVDTTYLSEDLYPKIPHILEKMKPYANLTESILRGKIVKSKKIFDNAKVTDHHAIIPTGELPQNLSLDEKKLYHLIALRFIATFYPDCEFTATTVLGKVLDFEFKATGKVIEKPGWKALYSTDKSDTTEDSPDKDEEPEKGLPEFTVGESGPHDAFLSKKTTQAPKPYTEGTLLKAMETAGRNIDSEELREALKENGIGRPSTRAAIIQTLYKRGYIRQVRKSLAPTPAGVELIATIQDDLLKSAKLTGIWENKLRRIESGNYSPALFIRELSEMIHHIVDSVLADNSGRHIDAMQGPEKSQKRETPETKAAKPKSPRAPAIRKFEQVPCPLCGEGHIVKGRKAFGCSRYAQGCRCILPFEEYPEDLTPAKLARKLKSKKR